MKAKLTFKLPKEQEEYNRANAALDMARILNDWTDHMRYIYRGKIEEPTMEKLCEEWFEIMEDINLDEIYT